MIPLARQSYRAHSSAIIAERLVNFYPEISPAGGRTAIALYGTPGCTVFSDCGSGSVRAMDLISPYAYVVVDSRVYRIDSAGSATLCTGDSIAAGQVTMANNGTQGAIVAGGNGYIVVGTNVTQIADPDFPGASSVAYVDGYFVFVNADGDQFFISALFDGTDFDALDFASAEGSPDDIVRVFVDHREIWLFGQQTTEIWQNVGNADFPFVRVDGAFLERGCAAMLSVAKADNSVFWLGDDKIVYRAAGYIPTRVSTHGIEEEIRKLGTIDDGIAWTYAQSGHTFYCLTFPTSSRTFVYDVASNLWHERQSGANTYDKWRITTGLAAFGKVLGGDANSGKVMELSLEVYAEDGEELRAVAQTPLIFSDGNNRIFGSSFEIVLETGVGLATGQGSDPQLSLQWSDDGGAIWTAENWKSMGPLGRRNVRLKWDRLGSFRNRMYRAVITDPVKRALVGFAPKMAEGNN